MRPIIETNSTAWSPWTQKDKHILDMVQRKCEKLSYPRCEFEPLSVRREKADLRETYKILNNYYKIDPEKFFRENPRGLRGHSRKLCVNYARTEVRRSFFTNRVIQPWNRLTEEAATAENLEAFKQTLSQDLSKKS